MVILRIVEQQRRTSWCCLTLEAVTSLWNRHVVTRREARLTADCKSKQTQSEVYRSIEHLGECLFVIVRYLSVRETRARSGIQILDRRKNVHEEAQNRSICRDCEERPSDVLQHGACIMVHGAFQNSQELGEKADTLGVMSLMMIRAAVSKEGHHRYRARS